MSRSRETLPSEEQSIVALLLVVHKIELLSNRVREEKEARFNEAGVRRTSSPSPSQSAKWGPDGVDY